MTLKEKVPLNHIRNVSLSLLLRREAHVLICQFKGKNVDTHRIKTSRYRSGSSYLLSLILKLDIFVLFF